MRQLIRILFVFGFLFFDLPSAKGQSGINQVNSKGERHGEWREYYDDDQEMLKFEGRFVNGKEIGLFKFYKEGLKQPAAILEFDANSDTVAARYLSQNGKTISEGKMVNKMNVGEWTYYHKDSDKIMMTENYKNGKLHGIKKIYYDNGVVAEEAHYANGELEGPRRLYSVKGVVLEDLLYEAGELHGPAKIYNGKGELMSEGNYKRNKHHGTWRYYENGNLKEEKEF